MIDHAAADQLNETRTEDVVDCGRRGTRNELFDIDTIKEGRVLLSPVSS